MAELPPLFIALRREWFEAFLDGSKTDEWRRYGSRWNETSCSIGRPVILSLGYTKTRLTGVIVGFRIRQATGPAMEIFGAGTKCAVIELQLDPA